MKPLKVKIRELFRESICSHKHVKRRYIELIGQSFTCCECEKCGKTWTE